MIDELLHDTNVWVALSFVIFVFVVVRYGKNAIIGMLDGRIAQIKKEIDTAEALRVEAQDLLAWYQRKQKETAEEAERIINNAKSHATEIKQQAEEDIEDLIARREEQLQGRLAMMKETAMQDLRTQAAALAVAACRDIVSTNLDDKTRASLADQGIEKVAFKDVA